MNLGEATIVLRSRRPMEVVDLSLRFLRRLAPRSFLYIATCTLLPAWLLCVLLRELGAWSWLALWPLAILMAWLCELPFLCLAGRLLFDRRATAAQALRDALRSLAPFLGSRLVLLPLLALSGLLVVGPLLVAASYCFSAEALVLERGRSLGSLRRARSLLQGRSGTGVETVVLRSLLFAGFVLVGELLARSVLVEGLDISLEPESLFADGGSPFALLGLFAAVPYTSTFRFLAYINERTRQDGWDVQVALLGVAEGGHD